jgi:hypothetical protein
MYQQQHREGTFVSVQAVQAVSFNNIYVVDFGTV